MKSGMKTIIAKKLSAFVVLCASALLLSAFCCNPIFPCASSTWQVYASTSFAGVDDGGDNSTSIGGQRIDQLPAYSDAFGYTANDGQGNVGAALTGSDGIYSTSRSTGTWILSRGGDPRFPDICSLAMTYSTQPGIAYPLQCQVGSAFDFSPNTIDVTNPPPFIFLSGASVSAQYGMPQVDFYDWTGKQLLSVTASAVSSDGSMLTLDTPVQMTAFPATHYGAIVYVVNSDGSLTPRAGASFNIVGRVQQPGDCGSGRVCP